MPGRELVLCRWLAVFAMAGALAHVAVAAHTPALTAVFAGMAVLCLPCAAHLWRGGRSALRLVAGNAAAMVAIHLAVGTGHHSGSAALAVLTVTEGGIAAGAWYLARHSQRRTA